MSSARPGRPYRLLGSRQRYVRGVDGEEMTETEAREIAADIKREKRQRRQCGDEPWPW